MAEQLANLQKEGLKIYSSEERIVGTWMGETLYEKSFGIDNPTDGTQVLTGVKNAFLERVSFKVNNQWEGMYNFSSAYLLALRPIVQTTGKVIIGLQKGTTYPSIQRVEFTLTYVKS